MAYYLDDEYNYSQYGGRSTSPRDEALEDIDTSLGNILLATRAYKKYLRKGPGLSRDEMREFNWSMSVLGKHADNYMPLTSNLKDIVQAGASLPGDVIDAAVGVSGLGHFFEDTLPFSASVATGWAGYKAAEPILNATMAGLSFIPGPIGAIAKWMRNSKKLYGWMKLFAKGAVSTYAGLTTMEIMKGNYDVDRLRALGVEDEYKTIGEIMKSNLSSLPRNTLAAMGVMHSLGYAGKKIVSLSKYNSVIDEGSAKQRTKKTTATAEEAQEAASKAFGEGEDTTGVPEGRAAPEEPIPGEEAERRQTNKEKAEARRAEKKAKKARKRQEAAEETAAERAAAEEEARAENEKRILQEEAEAAATEVTPEEARLFEEAGGTGAAAEEAARAAEEARIFEETVKEGGTGAAEEGVAEARAAAERATAAAAARAEEGIGITDRVAPGETLPPGGTPPPGEMPPPGGTPPPGEVPPPGETPPPGGEAAGAKTSRQQPTAVQRFVRFARKTIDGLADRKRVTLSDIMDTYEIKVDPITGEMKFNQDSPVKSEAKLSLLLELVYKSKLKGLSPIEKERFIHNLFHGVNNTGSALKMRFVTDGLFSNLMREGVTDFVKEFQALHKDPAAMAEMMNYYLGHPNNASAVAKVFADNIARTYKEIRHEFAKRGVIVPELDYNYAPQKARAEKIVSFGRKVFTQDLLRWVDLKKMGLDTASQAEIARVLNIIYDTFLEQDSFSDLSFTAGGESSVGALKQRRIIHFKDGKTHGEYLKKYGAFDNSVEAVVSNVQALANLLALVEHFGPDPGKLAANILGSAGNMYEGSASKGAPIRRPSIFKFIKETGEGLSYFYIKRANRNIYKAMFYKGESATGGLTSNLLASSLRIYNGIEAIGRNLVTANNAHWEIFETPLATAFLLESYKAGTTPGNIINFYKSSIEGLRAQMGKGLTAQQELALQEIGIRYGIQNDLMPFKYSVGTPYDMPLAMRKFNHMISKIKATDTLTQVNQTTAATMYQNMLGNHISQGTTWRQLPARIRGMLESGGVNAKDWATLLASDVLVHDSLFPDLPMEVNSNLLSPTYILKRNKGNPYLSVIAEKLLALQHNHVQRSVSSAQFESTAALLGEYSASRNFAGHLARNAIAFRGYQFDAIARWISMLDFEGHNLTIGRYASYVWQRTAIGLMVGVVRWGLAGRAPQLESTKDFLDFIMDGASRGDMLPISIVKEIFSDYYHSQGNNIVGIMQDKVSASAMGVGTQNLLQHAYNLTTGASKMMEGEYNQAFAKMRRAFPGSNFTPIDMIFNRLILDNIFASIDEDGFYQLAKKEMATNAKNHFKYYIEPGRFTKVKGGDISGATGLEAMSSSLEGEFRQERAEYRAEEYQRGREQGATKDIATQRAKIKASRYQPSNPLYQERKQARKAINAIQKKRRESDDPKVWDKLQAKADKIQAEYDLQVAEYYLHNRPATITARQAKNAYARAKRLAEQ